MHQPFPTVESVTDHTELPHVLVIGDPYNGFKLRGPFVNFIEASRFMDDPEVSDALEELEGQQVWITPVFPCEGITMSKIKIQRYVVEGLGRFPVDMLRFDMAWPDDNKSTGLISSPPPDKLYQIELRRVNHFHPNPDIRRWNSFGWKVLEESIRLENG